MNPNSSCHQPVGGLHSLAGAASAAGPAPDLAAGILVADASPLFLRGLQQVLAQSFAGCPLYEAASLPELLRATSHRRPALVLLATNLARTPEALPGLLEQLRQQHALVRVIVFLEPAAGFGSAGQRALRQRANGLLTRDASPAQVCEAVQEALQGGPAACLPVATALAGLAGRSSQLQATGGFSSRQLEILHLIAEEWSNEEIADSLCMSVRTVEYHRSQMLHRVGSRTTLGLVLFAHRQGLLPLRGGSSSLPAAKAPSRG
jgi:DNA-binding NarL/FixJ family response regulator